MNVSDEQIRDLILGLELIDSEKLNKALEEAQNAKVPFTEWLLANEYLKDSELGQILADHYGLPFVDLSQESIEPEVAELIPESVARAHQTVAYKKSGGKTAVATTNPSNTIFLKSLEQRVNGPVSVSYATTRGIDKALDAYKADVSGSIGEIIKQAEAEPDNQDLIIKLVDSLVEYASDSGASDIHLEPSEGELAFRLRIDGVMHSVLSIPKALADLILSRIKIMSKLRTDEKRAPQDGKFRFKMGKETLDVRVSIVPVTQGANVVMRLLATRGREFFLEALGFSEKDLEKVKEYIKSPHGMILTTGPTGSGKTTTLYTVLKLLHKPEVTIATIEDPVEYDMEGISQIQVNTKADLTFAKGLRSIVRQDPDIIMVGEIRDTETASIAVNSAMTGHLVLSTLHANNAPTAVPRLLEMEVEPFLISSTARLIIAQRLVRQICERCRESYQVEEKEKQIIEHDEAIKAFFKAKGYGAKKKIRLYRAAGCTACNNTGYRGRVGIFELMEMTEALRPLVIKRATSDEIMEAARGEGMTTMLEDGLEKALAGITTLDEVMRVTTL